MNNHEAIIRDNLAENLGILNPEYELISKEHYIPKGITTKSFIDILAKDRDNNYIIIEVKRSNQAERQAIHEIFFICANNDLLLGKSFEFRKNRYVAIYNEMLNFYFNSFMK